MTAHNTAKAKAYLATLDIPIPFPTNDLRTINTNDFKNLDGDISPVFDQAKAQSQVVGSAILSFSQGVPEQTREAISDAALLAQLVANKEFSSFEAAPKEWFSKYSEVLQNIGWVLQEQGWGEYEIGGNAAEVHEKILDVLTIALAPSVAATKILTGMIAGLRAMSPENQWFTLFNQESRHANTARFQIGLVEAGTDGLFVSLLACLIEAQSNLTQVLFFKFNDAVANFSGNSIKASINETDLQDLSSLVDEKIRGLRREYVSTIKNLDDLSPDV